MQSQLPLAGLFLCAIAQAQIQLPLPLPPYISSFGTTAATRGLWFTAPAGGSFTITGLRVPNEMNQPFQSIEVVDLNGVPPPVFSATVVGTQLFYVGNAPSGTIVPCNVTINPGQVIGVLGVCTTISGGGTAYSSYGTPVGPFTSDILGVPVTMTRFGTQFNIATGGNRAVWQEPGSNVSRIEIYVVPTNGIYANFIANVTGGGTPLSVNFSNASVTSDPGGVTSYAWDFNGDSVTDSTLQNPTFVYTTCGTFSVSLTVTDATHAPSTTTRTAYIVTDTVTPNFTTASLGGNLVQFTDTSTPPGTSWAWDLDGDNVTDSTLQNPTWNYPTACAPVNVTLTVNRLCRGPFTLTRLTAAARTAATCSLLAGGITSASATAVGNMFDLVVNNPQGISVCAITSLVHTFTGAFNADVYVTPGTYVGNNLNAAVWRLVGSGTGTSNGGTVTTATRALVPMATPFYLAPGNYGMAVYLSRTPAATTNLASTTGPLGPYGNADVTFIPSSATAPGIATLALFSGTVTASRVWNGQLHYTTTAATGAAGFGFFAPGCAGTLGIPGNTATSLPRLGQTMTTNVSRLNLNAAFHIVGFSRTSSLFGPLPFNLTALGAPGCFGRVSTDSVVLIAGAGNTASYNLTVPNNAVYLGTQLYTQALAIDTGFNTLGGVTSDAAALIVGS